MNLYTMVRSGNGTPEAAALSVRLAAWHDAMVAHDRLIRAGRADVCDEECPHAEARTLWVEALEVFGDRAQELTFLRSRATAASSSREEVIASADVPGGPTRRGRRTEDSGRKAVARRSKPFVGSSERSRIERAEL
jgi:hypothetical protein